ncbi:MAG TPA: M14 family zinc carboxypeptidase [Urbifossiella sp.]|nr:M14 family zinc carboxypeptidase [Urbifossiella sp.]
MRWLNLVGVLCLLGVSVSAAPPAPDRNLPEPELRPDGKIPPLKDVVGHTWGEDVSSSAEVERYIRALVAAAPTRTRLETYGKTYEGRPLHLLTISSPKNIKNLEEIRKANLLLADPRRTTARQAETLSESAPAVVWLSYCVHGDETSPSDAALLTAYHLLSDTRPETAALLENLVVIIDPIQNPDGRDRFVNFHRERRGVFVESEPQASDRIQRWPGGRYNHYLFDMNRDWYQQSQAESGARVAAYLRWLPQLLVDSHEMGANDSFFFDPPGEPIGPFLLPRQREWYLRVGKNHARRFDERGFAYTTREMFDGFGPQYGSTYPTLHGTVGFLWEQGGVRGRVVERKDQTMLHYRDGVRHNYVSGLAVLEVASANRAALLRDFHHIRDESIELGKRGPVCDYFLLEGARPGRAADLAALLRRNGVEVHRVSREVRATTTDIAEGKTEERTVPVGSYHVPVAQPASRVARSLLDRELAFPKAFIDRQLQRQARGQDHEIYDTTAWSLPLAYGVTCLATSEPVAVETDYTAPKRGGGGKASVAYLVSGGEDAAMRGLCDWLRAGLRVHVATEPLKVAGVTHPRGTLILKVNGNPDSVHAAAEKAAKDHDLTLHAANSGFVEGGVGLGGPSVVWVKPPRALLLVGPPANVSVGHTWYAFDQVWRYPVTRTEVRSLSRGSGIDLRRYDVVIMPDGGYGSADGPGAEGTARLKEFVNQGGTLILVKGAVDWAAGEKVGLLAATTERRPLSAAEKAAAAEDKGKQEAKERPHPSPGAFFRASADEEDWLTFGVPPRLDVMFTGNTILTPLKLSAGRNLVTFRGGKAGLTSGFCWPDTLELLSGKPYLFRRTLGHGQLIGFADDPNFRACCPETQRLFFNAVMFGPALQARGGEEAD